MKKQLIYYFYIDSYDIYEVYKVHLECIKSYDDIFFKYTFILSLDDINNQELIEYWKNIINDYIKKDKKIEYIIVQNNKLYREGIHYYNYIFKKLNEFDGLLLWGHGKRDNNYSKENIYEWIISSHYIMSHNINEIENKLIYDKYLFSGPNLSFMNGDINKQIYQGSFYWMNPKKIYNKLKNDINIFTNFIDLVLNDIYINIQILKDKQTNIDKVIRYISEFSILFKIKYLHHFQNNLIECFYIDYSDNFNYTESSLTYNDLYINKFSETIINFYNDNIKNGFKIYYENILNNISAKEKENTN